LKASDTQIFRFLEGSKQFAVPLFQRTYSWKEEHIRRFWDDLEETVTDISEETKDEGESTHFFGSFVTLPTFSSPSAVPKYILIDGQQRLVTTSIFLSLLRKRIADIDPESKMKDEIYDQYLVNKYCETPEDKYKIVPTQADRDIFFSIVEDLAYAPRSENRHLIAEAWRFFERELSRVDELKDLRKLKDGVLRKFSVVDICLEEDDDPYLIFESLNATGTPLTQSDLIRNYLFMRINTNNQQEVYDQIWFPMQQQLGSHLETFLRHHIALKDSIPSFRKIYKTFKKDADENAKDEKSLINLMKDLAKFSSYYCRFLYPEKESEPRLRERFKKIRMLDVTTCYPLLMNLYNDYIDGNLSVQELSQMIRTIETYIVRRAVCEIPPAPLNRFFPTVYRKIEKDSMVDSFEILLKKETGTTRMPTDDEFRTSLEERDLYGNNILRFLLEEIEMHDNKEPVDTSGLEIEHIMPETLSDKWKEELGDRWELIHQKYLHTLGNLTLTGYNQEYYNRTFIEKRDLEKGYKQSNLKLNRELAKLRKWTDHDIKHRATRLSNTAMRIWSL